MGSWEDLNEMLNTGRISRREFMARAVALGVSTALAGSVLSGTVHAAEKPRKGGRLVVGLNGAGPGDNLDPATYTATFLQVFGQMLYNTLTEVDVGADLRSKPSVQPALAESWDARSGAKEWVFKIRRGVTFHNGKTLTADDVVYSLNHHRREDSKSGAKSLLAPIVELKASGKYEVTVTLESGNADLPYILADYHLGIGPEGVKFTEGVGTGAFTLEKFEPGVRALARRYSNHYRSDRGHLDSVEVRGINDTSARIQALLDGSVQLINKVDPKAVLRLVNNQNLEVFEISGGAHYSFPMRCDMAPFDNGDLRAALKYIVNRPMIVSRVLQGHGKIGNDHPVPSHDRFFAAALSLRPFDPDKARFHYKKSGHSGPIVLSVSEAGFTGATEAARILQAGAARAGIRIEIEEVPAEGYWKNVWMKKPFCASYWSGRPTADLMFSVAYKSDAAWNESFWKRPEFDRLLIAARAELDIIKRRVMYRDLQEMVHVDGGEIIPMFNNLIDAGSKKLKGFVALPTSEMSGYRAIEKVWLEA